MNNMQEKGKKKEVSFKKKKSSEKGL